MARHSIEETFRSLAPKRRNEPGSQISVGVSSYGSGVSESMSQAAQEITRLRSVYQTQSDLITANTQAVQGNTAAQGSGHSVAGTIGSVASSMFGGALSFLPLVSGIAKLFGGGSSKPAPLVTYAPPAPVQLEATLRSGSLVAPQLAQTSTNSTGVTQGTSQAKQTAPGPQVTVNISAMDSQSFLDRSGDIANAVRDAMLNLHSINGVVADL